MECAVIKNNISQTDFKLGEMKERWSTCCRQEWIETIWTKKTRTLLVISSTSDWCLFMTQEETNFECLKVLWMLFDISDILVLTPDNILVKDPRYYSNCSARSSSHLFAVSCLCSLMSSVGRTSTLFLFCRLVSSSLNLHFISSL